MVVIPNVLLDWKQTKIQTSEAAMEDRETGSGSKIFVLLDYLAREFDGYPYDYDKDHPYFRRLIDDFSELDVEEELKQFHAWTLDQAAGKKIYYRSRFRTWLKTALSFLRNPPQRIPYWLQRRNENEARWK
jgi:hypothetical protein